MFQRKYIYLLLCLIPAQVFSQSWLSRQWHNTVSHYNYYYNANNLVVDVRDEAQLIYKDNYKDVLSLYPIPDASTLKGNAAKMDEVLKKCSFIIDKHSKSKWVDNSYLLMGDAHMFKGDFYSAIEVYEFVAGNFKNTDEAIYAQIKLLTLYVLMTKYEDAEALYGKLSTLKTVPEKYKLELNIAGAAVNIKQVKYPNAIKLLEESIPKVKNKFKKVRYNFVLAQLYGLMKKNTDALERYKKVIKLNPPYEFAFNAKLNIAKSINPKNRNEIKNAKTILRNMLKDDKNIDYFDQIYFELGNLELADKNEKGAIVEYRNCLNAKSNDAGIKSSAYLALADLYFKFQDYENAQAYYDSAARTITPDHKDYQKVQDKNSVLNELIKHLVNIREKDSLLRLSENEKLREKTIDKLIRDAKDAEENKRQAEENKKFQQDNLANANQSSGSGNFPFYNNAARSKGLQDFQRIWGNRELTDFWAISSNSQKVNWEKINDQQNKNDKGDIIKNELLKNASEERKKYYENIPFTIAEKQKLKDEAAESYFLGANVYYQSLKEYEKAKLLLEELNIKYPKNKYQINSWYLLARIYMDVKNKPKADYYINLIKEADPKSNFLSVLMNDTTGSDSANLEKIDPNKEVEVLYAKTYNAYKDGKYDEALSFKKENDTKYPGSPLQVNFDYIDALIEGRRGDKKVFRTKLQAIVDNYPNTDISVQCLKTIELIKIQSGETSQGASAGKYTYNPANDHFYMLLVPKGIDITQLKLAFINYNKSFHPEAGLRVTTSLLGDQFQILIVNNFKSMEEAKAFYKEMMANTKFFTETKISDPSKQFIISKENFSILILEKLLDDYTSFFTLNYKS